MSKQKRLSIVFATRRSQSASEQSRASADDSSRHATRVGAQPFKSLRRSTDLVSVLFFYLKIVEFELEAPGTGKGKQAKTIKYRFCEAKEPKRECAEPSRRRRSRTTRDASGGEALQISPSPPTKKELLSTKSSFFVIQAAGLAYHRRAKRGVYHQPLWGCISSALACIPCGLMRYNTSC